MRILVLTNRIPYPPISGSTLRIYHLLRRVARHHQVWLATNMRASDSPDSVAAMEEFCEEVLTGRLREQYPIMHLPGLLRYAAAGWPLEHKFNYSPELAHKLKALFARVDFDVIQVEEDPMIHYLTRQQNGVSCPRILSFYDVHFAQAARLTQVESRPVRKVRRWLYSRAMRNWEPRVAERFDRCIAVSDIDRDLLLQANSRLNVTIVPNGVDTRAYQPLPLVESKPALLFIGSMSYIPCHDAALYFANEIFPLVRQAVPDIELWIVGADPMPGVRALDGGEIHVTGRVPEVVPYYSRAQVSVVPLRAGGGTRLKILEAMALNRPVVSTTVGCEGLEVTPGEHLLVADTPEAFAQQTVALLTDASLYARITANGRALVEALYDWDSITTRLLEIYDDVLN